MIKTNEVRKNLREEYHEYMKLREDCKSLTTEQSIRLTCHVQEGETIKACALLLGVISKCEKESNNVVQAKFKAINK